MLSEEDRGAVLSKNAAGNHWGLAVAKSRRALLAAVKADGRLGQAWRDWLPALDYPFTTSSPPATD